MSLRQEQLKTCPETVLVGLARSGSRDAFAELVRRRQTWIRNLLRRCCGNAALADDLAQDAFYTAWRAIPRLETPSRFPAWLKRIAINVWLQHARRNDPLVGAGTIDDTSHAGDSPVGLGMDLDRALAALPEDVRVCIVLGYHESMTHPEIAELTGLPLGTVKSHIRRGAEKLRETLGAYVGEDSREVTS